MLIHTLKLDEPWTFLNARGNPVEGRRLTFELQDGTIVTVDVSHSDYRNVDAIRSQLEEAIGAHEAVLAL